MNKDIEKLKERIVEIFHLSSAAALLSWDQEVMMPEKSSDIRAQTYSCLAGVVHDKIINTDKDGLLTKLKKQLDANKLTSVEAVIVAETYRNFLREVKLPEKFVKELAAVESKSQVVWARAKEKNDFSLFLPYLSKIVKLKRLEAKLIGYKDSPYDALLDVFEPGMTVSEITMIFNDLKDFLIPFLKKIKNSKEKIDGSLLKGSFSTEKQVKIDKMIAKKIGFDFERGRLDDSVHPFTIGLNPADVRITTRYKKDDIFQSIGSTIHESGHAMYEQGLPIEYCGTPLAENISTGIHESQSRMWENNIGKSKEFWRYFFPKIKKEFPTPLAKISIKDIYKIINKVEPSLIRTEADEVTYNLHIILRFEIEKEMIEGSIDLKDLPKIWNSKFENYFGIKVPSNSLGVLQDVHWSCGLFGYFPAYSLGNLYAAQFYQTMTKKIPGLKNKIANGDFTAIKKWLNKNIHAHGKTYTADDLVRQVTGESLSSVYFNNYIEEKYQEIYNLKY